MSTMEKLKQLQSQAKAKTTQSNMTKFDSVVVVHVGVEVKPHYPKLKNELGQNVKDERGQDKRAKESDGYTYTFVEFATAKIVKIVLKKLYNFEPLKVFEVGGEGYDIKQANLIFIEKNTTIKEY